MFQVVRPVGLALAGACLLPLAAFAMPIKAVNGPSTSVTSSRSGPKHPGLIPPTAPDASLSSASALTNRRGRPVPSQSKMAGLDENHRTRVAETGASRTPSEL